MVVDFKTKNVIESITDDPEINELIAKIKKSLNRLNRSTNEMESLTKWNIHGMYNEVGLIESCIRLIALKRWGRPIDIDFLKEALNER